MGRADHGENGEREDMDIRMEILTRRRQRITEEGFGLSADVPAERRAALVPVDDIMKEPFVICEIKRASPSRGTIAVGLDPVEQAGIYREMGCSVVSVITEEDHFHGSLDDLMRVKDAYPDLAVLRKDFLFCKEDIDSSYRAGADLVLLIASLLSAEELAYLYQYTRSYGMTPLVEVHDASDMRRVRGTAPLLTGINCRDLTTFKIDRLFPVLQRPVIDWPTVLVYESGIWTEEDAFFAGRQGFQALLVGESVVRNPERIPDLSAALVRGTGAYASAAPASEDFWSRLMLHKRPDRPLVKVCGITNRDDAELALMCGADILGFICAESPREVDAALIESLMDLDVLKVAVIVDAGEDTGRFQEMKRLLEKGAIDAIQFHGDESPEACSRLGHPYYKALRLRDEHDVARVKEYRSPRVLIDAYHPVLQGGTGRQIDRKLVDAVRSSHVLWLAGGITPDNVKEVLERYEPELIDVSSGLERSPGRKDPEKMRRFFQTIEGVYA